jgi:hypothetical protein
VANVLELGRPGDDVGTEDLGRGPGHDVGVVAQVEAEVGGVVLGVFELGVNDVEPAIVGRLGEVVHAHVHAVIGGRRSRDREEHQYGAANQQRREASREPLQPQLHPQPPPVVPDPPAEPSRFMNT